MNNILDIVGITTNTCDCYGAIKNNYHISKSGLYIDSYLVPFLALQHGCDNKDGWEQVVDAYDLARDIMGNDLRMKYLECYTKLKNDFAIEIGRRNYVSIDFTNKNPKIVIPTKNIRGYKFSVNSIGLVTTKNGSIDVTFKQIKRNGEEVILRTVTVLTSYGKDNLYLITNGGDAAPIEMECDGSIYEISYELGIYNSYTNTIKNSCSSCNSDLQEIMPFLERNLVECNKDNANGFIIGITGQCDTSIITEEVLRVSPEFMIYFADMVCLKTGIIMMEQCLNNATYFSVVNSDSLLTTLKIYNDKYNNKLKQITPTILPKLPNTCFALKSTGLSVG